MCELSLPKADVPENAHPTLTGRPQPAAGAAAPAARMMATAEVSELPAQGGGEDHLAGIRVRERGTDARRAVGVAELGERDVDALTARDRLAVFEEHRRLDGRMTVEPLGERARV